MQTIGQIKEQVLNGDFDMRLAELYMDELVQLEYQRQRYCKLLENYEQSFGREKASIYSAPGRSEIGGNHTDHQNGEVLAGAINLDVIAAVSTNSEPIVRIISEGGEMVEIFLEDLSFRAEEQETTKSLIKGVLAGIRQHGYEIGGFYAYITSDVRIGAGLSSSAAFETMIGTIVSGLYNEMKISPVEIALIGQYAEREYFGKPCGLMDQIACSVGGLVHIDFSDETKPVVEKLACDLQKYGYCLCITDTRGSHADLTAEYTAIPQEMRGVAEICGEKVLRDISLKNLLENAKTIREMAGDRAFLRAIHFVTENQRVQKETKALQVEDFNEFLKLVKESGNSSFKYLQNVYAPQEVKQQSLSVALAISDSVLGENGVSRVHGGGFAGTIQAFVKNEMVTEYKTVMDEVFGAGACNVLKIRQQGGIKVL